MTIGSVTAPIVERGMSDKLNYPAKKVIELTPLTEPYVYVYDAHLAMLNAMCSIARRYTEFAIQHGFETAAKMIDDELKEARSQLAKPIERRSGE